MLKLSSVSIISLFLILMLALSVSAVTRARESNLEGGWQIWIDTSDFERHDNNDLILLGEEAPKALRDKATEPVLGEDFVIAPSMGGWMEYDFESTIAGDAYVYPRIACYRGGGQSWLVHLNADATGLPYNTAGPVWTWNVTNPADGVTYVPLSPEPLVVGTNTVKIAPREAGAGVEVLMDMICVSTEEFEPTPTDDEWNDAKPFGGKAVESIGKLATRWGAIKSAF